MPPLRVLIADDHQPFAESLGLTLDFDERVEVAGSARNGKEAVRLALELQPDAVLMDLEMPVLDGIQATRMLRRLLPACPVVVLTASLSPEDAHRARTRRRGRVPDQGLLGRARRGHAARGRDLSFRAGGRH